MSAEPAKPSTPVKPDDTGYVLVPGTKLRTRDVTGLALWPATGTHRVIKSCRAGHEEVVDVHTWRERLEATVSGCRTVMPEGGACTALVNVTRYVGPDGCLIGLIMIPDPKTPAGNPEAAR